jgi:hypothetical protein
MPDNEPQICTICGKKALFKVNNLGFCKKHELQAIAYKKQFPIERTEKRIDNRPK